MLQLDRQLGETIVINEQVVITIAKISGNQIKLKIEAPRHIDIVREELLMNNINNEKNSNLK